MTRSRTFRPFGLRRKDNTSGGRRLAAWTAALGAVVLLAGVLQAASAASLFQGTTPSQTEVTSSSNPSVVGESVTFTAVVSDFTGLASAAPTGYVEFEENDVPIPECSGDNKKELQLNASTGEKEASCTKSYSAPTTTLHTVTASYGGDGTFEQSEAQTPVSQTVNKADTSTDVVSSDTIAKFGQSVTFTATVTVDSPGSGDPSGGTVEFSDGGTGIPECSGANSRPVTKNTTNDNYEATCTVSNLAIGDHSITAKYGGNDILNESEGPATPIDQKVEKADTTVIVESSDLSSKTTQAVTLTATVSPTPPGGGTPTGSVTFHQDGNPVSVACTNVMVSATTGQASCSHTFSSAGSYAITAVYSSDSDNYNGNTSGAITQVVRLPYVVTASVSTSGGDPSNASFRVSGGPARSYTLCVRLEGTWRSGPRDDLRTPEPNGGDPGESWATKWTLNTNDRCKGFTWKSGTASTKSLYPTFGFATKGTYLVTLKINGDEIDTATFNWNSWCPPSGLRDVGTWRPSRLKTYDSCKSSSGYVGKGGSRSSLDADLGWRWMSGLGRLHVEYVAMDSGWYSNPTTGTTPLLRSPGGAGTDNRWTLWGNYKCDTYHGWKEFHRVHMAQQGNAIFISGAQYSTKTPSVSGTWSAHKC